MNNSSPGICQVDVFASRPGRGNPLAVVLGAGRLAAAEMQRMAAWFNLAETTFLLPATTAAADYRVRIFSARQEIAFAGHPSIGTAHAALACGFARARDGQLRQECVAGVLPIQVEEFDGGSMLSVRVPRSRIVGHRAADAAALARALGDRRLSPALAPALVEGGRRWWLAELADEDQVRSMQPDHAAIRALAASTGSLGLCVFARATGNGHDLVVRAFPLGVGLDEDPASGAANAAIAAFLDESGALGSLGKRYRVSQGREMRRDAELHLRVDDESQVWVGGQCHIVVHGSIRW